MKTKQAVWIGMVLVLVAVGLVLAGCGSPPSSNLATPGHIGYMIGENAATANKGPVRLARFSYLTGTVDWRPNASTSWSKAGINLPTRQGAQIWAKDGSRSELQFDDGSMMRLGGGAVATLQTMYSDDHGEFTEVKLNDGLATFYLRNKESVFQIDTPLSSVKAVGPTEVRVGAGKVVEVACRSGSVNVFGRQGTTVLRPRQRLEIPDQVAAYSVTELPEPDAWDNFNEQRDAICLHRNAHLPADIDLVAGNLDDYGTWHDDPDYGYVWAPRVHEANWRPYHDGHWVWISPWGWTWVGDEDWGYAPYHYGTWVHRRFGWAWCPGPQVQYWSPAVVDYVDDGTYVGWAPLAPGEVVYPSGINIGFHSGNWWVDFSIGGVAAYYPHSDRYCEPRPWDNVYVNREVNYYDSHDVHNVYNNFDRNSADWYSRDSRFIPQNGTRFAGLTLARRTAFVDRGAYLSPGADPSGRVFHRGFGYNRAPGNWQVSGPPTLMPQRQSFTTTRAFVQGGGPPASLVQRQVVRADVTPTVARYSAPTRGGFVSAMSRTAVVPTPVRNRALQPGGGRFGTSSNAEHAMRPGVAPNIQRKTPSFGNHVPQRVGVAPSHGRTPTFGNHVPPSGGTVHQFQAPPSRGRTPSFGNHVPSRGGTVHQFQAPPSRGRTPVLGKHVPSRGVGRTPQVPQEHRFAPSFGGRTDIPHGGPLGQFQRPPQRVNQSHGFGDQVSQSPSRSYHVTERNTPSRGQPARGMGAPRVSTHGGGGGGRQAGGHSSGGGRQQHGRPF